MTPKQNELLRYVAAAIDRTGISPSYAECVEALAIKSKGNICRLVSGLIDRGYLAREGGKNRSLVVTPAGRAIVARHSLGAYSDQDLKDELGRRYFAANPADQWVRP